MPFLGSAQVIIEFDNMTLNKPLPYQQKFIIEGSRQFVDSKAVAATLTIERDKSQSADKEWLKTAIAYAGDQPTEYSWWLTDPSNAKYRFLVTNGLTYGVKYKLTFKFYLKSEYGTDLKAEVAKRTHDVLTNQTSPLLNASSIKNAVDQVTSQLISEKKLQTLEVKDGKVSAKTLVAVLRIDQAVLIEKYITKERIRDGRKSTKGIMLVDISEKLQPDWLSKFKAEMTTHTTTTPPLITGGQLSEMDNFVMKHIPLSEQVSTDLSKLTTISTDLKNFISRARSISLSLADVNNDIDRLTREIEAFEPKYKSSFDALFDNIYTVLYENSTVELSSTQAADANSVDKTRWSVIVGAGVAAVGPADIGKTNPNPIAYLCFKRYMFSPVDKTVENPYLKNRPFLNHLSLIAGWRLAGDLRYRGQNMESVLGLKPVAGVSYDIVPTLSVDLFSTFYSQPDQNPFVVDRKLRGALTIGISLDLDLLNRLRGLLGNSGYTIPKAQ